MKVFLSKLIWLKLSGFLVSAINHLASLINTSLKINVSFKKHYPIQRHYRDYKYSDQTKLENNLNKKLSEGISNYESFETTFLEVLNKHAPLRKKVLRANHAPYITKTLRKAIMHRSQLVTNDKKA